MAINVTASSLVLAALALVGDYSATASTSVHRTSAAPFEKAVKGQSRQELRRVVMDISEEFLEMDTIYANAIQTMLKRDCFDAELFEKLPHHISMTRGLEAALRGATVPDDLADAHMSLRRAVAKVRGRLVQMESLLMQAHEAPKFFASDIDMNGLKALAEHSTARLALRS